MRLTNPQIKSPIFTVAGWGVTSHGQLFRPYWGLSAFHSRRTSVRIKSSSEVLHC